MKLFAKLKKRFQNISERTTRYAWRVSIGALAIVGTVLIVRPLVSLIRTSYEIRQLRNEKAKYEEQLLRDSLFMEQLKSDEFLEQYARETYFMQRPHEQVFIVGE